MNMSELADHDADTKVKAKCHICGKKKSVTECHICGLYYCGDCASPIQRDACKKCAP